MWEESKTKSQFSQTNEKEEGNNKLKKSLKKLDKALDEVKSDLGQSSHKRRMFVVAGVSALLSSLLTMKIMPKHHCNCNCREKK